MSDNFFYQSIGRRIGRVLARYLTQEVRDYKKFSTHRLETLQAVMQPGDVLLVEGDHRISSIIKYLTQSTWSHAALYVGNVNLTKAHTATADVATLEDNPTPPSLSGLMLIEADLQHGVIAVPLEKYSRFNIRICRPFNLDDVDQRKVCQFMIDSIGMRYDLKNVADLARYLLPKPPVPKRWRRRMLALGSGKPTQAICSSLVAKAFQSINYPILPDVLDCGSDGNRDEILHIRHHSLFAPRDFDVSPYFDVVKPDLHLGFDYKSVNWYSHSDEFLVNGESDFDCRLCRERSNHTMSRTGDSTVANSNVQCD